MSSKLLQSKACRYCCSLYQKNSEHVFPFALGGENIYMDCVCENCNNRFSSIERELYQKSPIALYRSLEGISGYKSSKSKPAPLKAPILLGFDEENKIAYEVGQHFPMEIFIRPQILNIKGKFYLEGDTHEGMKKFIAKFDKWRKSNLKIVTRLSSEKENAVFVEFQQSGMLSSSYDSNQLIKIKDEIIVNVLDESHELYSFLEPRLFIDDDGKLRIRAKTKDEAIIFVQNLLAFALTKTPLRSFSRDSIENIVISVGLNFDYVKYDQAVVKIVLNCLMYYYPESRDSLAIEDYIAFVTMGNPLVQIELGEGKNLTDSSMDSHCIFFYQYAEAVHVRLSLFNGKMVHSFQIPNLIILKPNEYSRLLIDYNRHKNRLENQFQFMESFNTNRSAG